ncbi:MAG: redoxin domain-containing protein [Planctomycetes bacterium]|nr:redoxin domain-containing protein [Planctomycetota bacterium]
MPSEHARSTRASSILSILSILSFSLVPAVPCLAAENNPLPIGAAAPDFNLPGVDDRNWSLQDFSEAEVLVVIFTCNHCPTAQAYEDRIIKLHDEYKDRRVAIVTISPNDPQAVRLDELGYSDLGDSLEDMKLRAAQMKFPFPYLYDGDIQQVSRAYGALATPHVFIFDRARELRYVGAVDDNERAAPKVLYVRDAIEDLLAGRPVARENTRVFGCSTKWSDKRDSARQSVEKWDKEPVTLSQIDAAGVRKLIANDSDKYRLINVWATWCVPCVTELPELVTINRMYRRRPFELITISIDSPAAKDQALKMLREKHVATTNYLFESDDRDALADALDKQWQGPVPYTILIAPGGEVLYRQLNVVEPLELKRAIVERLGRTYK